MGALSTRPISPCRKGRVTTVFCEFLKYSLACLFVLMSLAITTQSTIASPASTPAPSRYEVGAGTLDEALQSFASQSNIQLLYSTMLVRGKHSDGLRGNHTLATGLTRLLAEHGLTAVAVNANTYLLRNAKKQSREASGPATSPERSLKASMAELATVTVTGTRIPQTSLELSVPMTVITADDIERSGRQTLYDLLGERPGLASHHPMTVSSEGRNYPTVVASGASLYSLGPRATLFLLNGKRIAPFGLASNDLGGLVDLNSIPLSFIDRIEILRGGASAVYGADAMAGTVNIILKKDQEGGEISSRLGISQRGDALSRQTSVIFGTQTQSGGQLLLAADISSQDELGGDRRDWHTNDRSRFGLPDDRLPIGFSTSSGVHSGSLPLCQAAGENPDSPYCRFDSARYRTLQPRVRNKSAYIRWDQELGDSFSLYFSGLRTRSEQTLQNSPVFSFFPITPSHPDYAKAPGPGSVVDYAFYELGAPRNHTASTTNDMSIGVDGLALGWNWNVALSHSESRVHSATNNVLLRADIAENLNRLRIDGSDNTEVMNAMRGFIRPAGYNSVSTLEATSNRSLFEAFDATAQIVVGTAFHFTRRRSIPDPLQVNNGIALGSTVIEPYNLHSRDSTVFTELNLPLHRTLQMDLAARLDHPQGFQSNTSPRIGFKWTPGRTFLARASFGEGYRAPSLNEARVPFDDFIDTRLMQATPQLMPCIQVGSDRCRVEYGVGDNPNLRAEFSRSRTLGVAWAPTHAFSASLDRYHVSRTDEFGIADAFSHPSLFPEGLVRDANGVLYRANRFLANIGKSETRGWELESNYLLRHEKFGELGLHLAAHYLNRYTTSSIIQPKAVERAGHDTPKLTLLGDVQWRHGHWATTLTARHFGSLYAYPAGEACPKENRDSGKCSNPAATLLSLNIRYSGQEGWSYAFGINNLLDRRPVDYRFYAGGYNVAVDDVYGRYFTMAASYRF
ncbi:Colicin I receptor precursor [compost metagenome]